ncbi:MAG: GGDEF domain-containing protein [Pseudomonadota bacterium]
MRISGLPESLRCWWTERSAIGKLAALGAGAIVFPLMMQSGLLLFLVEPGAGVLLSVAAMSAVLASAIFGFAVMTILAPLRQIEKNLQSLAADHPPALLGAEPGQPANRAGQIARKIVRLHDRLRKEAATYQSEAETDPLTGLYNRRGFDNRRKGIESAALLYIDIDKFKQINDGLGHAAGDELLQRTAKILLSATRDHDVVARVGGDEFVILLPDIPQARALAIAERLRSASARDLKHAFGHATISIGVAHLNGGRLERALELADQACYAAKRAGRDRVYSQPERDLAPAAPLIAE